MKKLSTLLLLFVVAGCSSDIEANNTAEAAVNEVSAPLIAVDGNVEVGTVTVRERADGGVTVTVVGTGLEPGEHGFHVHGNPSDPKVSENASSHWDPELTGVHEGPHGNGHRGDFPFLTIPEDGNLNMTVENSRVAITDIENSGRYFIIHIGGDTYSDYPERSGGGGPALYTAQF